MAGDRGAFFVAANAETFAKEISYTNIFLADCTGALDGPSDGFNGNYEIMEN